MKLTREQFNKWNAQAHNDFIFNIERYCIWNEKQLVKNVHLENGEIIEFNLLYFPEYENITNQYGCSYNRRTGNQIPVLSINRLIPLSTEGMYRSIDIKRGIPMGEPEKTKKYSTLCKISASVDTAIYMAEIIGG